MGKAKKQLIKALEYYALRKTPSTEGESTECLAAYSHNNMMKKMCRQIMEFMMSQSELIFIFCYLKRKSVN
jgi:hypothetical protein